MQYSVCAQESRPVSGFDPHLIVLSLSLQLITETVFRKEFDVARNSHTFSSDSEYNDDHGSDGTHVHFKLSMQGGSGTVGV